MGGFKDRRREQVGEKSEYWPLYPSRACGFPTKHLVYSVRRMGGGRRGSIRGGGAETVAE